MRKDEVISSGQRSDLTGPAFIAGVTEALPNAQIQ
jgi:hypothetical protein